MIGFEQTQVMAITWQVVKSNSTLFSSASCSNVLFCVIFKLFNKHTFSQGYYSVNIQQINLIKGHTLKVVSRSLITSIAILKQLIGAQERKKIRLTVAKILE